MKINPKYHKTVTKYGEITITDIDGESMSFAGIKEAAKFLDVSVMAIYKVLRVGGKVRGCTVTSKLKAKKK